MREPRIWLVKPGHRRRRHLTSNTLSELAKGVGKDRDVVVPMQHFFTGPEGKSTMNVRLLKPPQAIQPRK